MIKIQIEKARPQQVGIREVKKKRWKRIFTSHFSLHSQWESRKVKMPEVAASAPLTLDLIRPSRFGLRKTRTLWILPNSTPSDAARKKRLISVLVTKAAQDITKLTEARGVMTTFFYFLVNEHSGLQRNSFSKYMCITLML